MAIGHGPKGLQARKPRKGTWTATKRAQVCAKLTETCNVSASCRAVGMSIPGFYALRRRDAAFRALCDAAIAQAYFEIELQVLQRQRKGVRRPVFHGGRKVGTVTHYSDAVALALLRMHRGKAEGSAESEQARAQQEELERLRLEARLSEMNRRMGGEG